MLPLIRSALRISPTVVLLAALAVGALAVPGAMAGGDDRARGVVVDFEGNAVVWGFSKKPGAQKWDFFTRKYAADGSTVWSRRFANVSYNESASERLLGVDANGTVYIGGAEDVVNSHRPIIVRYSAAGEERALTAFSYHGTLRALAVRSTTAVVAAGEVWQNGSWDFLTVKKLYRGINPGWQKTYDSGVMDVVPDVTSAADGSVYVAGMSDDSTVHASDIKVLKYDAAGNLLWSRTWDVGDMDYPALNGAVAVDAGGNLYVLASKGSAGSHDVGLRKYSPAGTKLWTRTYDGGGGVDWGQSVKLDGNGNILVLAAADVTNWAFGTLKYDAAGTLLWNAVYDDFCNDVPESLKVDGNGFVYVTGYSKSATAGTGRDFLTIKYTPELTAAWSRLLDGGLGKRDRPTSVAVDAAGNVYVTGETWKDDNGNDRDYLTVKYSADGVVLWTRTYDSQ